MIRLQTRISRPTSNQRSAQRQSNHQFLFKSLSSPYRSLSQPRAPLSSSKLPPFLQPRHLSLLPPCPLSKDSNWSSRLSDYCSTKSMPSSQSCKRDRAGRRECLVRRKTACETGPVLHCERVQTIEEAITRCILVGIFMCLGLV